MRSELGCQDRVGGQGYQPPTPASPGKQGRGPQQVAWGPPPTGQGTLPVGTVRERQVSWSWQGQNRGPFLGGRLFLGEAAAERGVQPMSDFPHATGPGWLTDLAESQADGGRWAAMSVGTRHTLHHCEVEVPQV